jgi:hypothetical protein
MKLLRNRWYSGGSPLFAAVGVVCIAPVIPKQAIVCTLLSSALLVLSLTLGHRILVA